MLRNFDQIVESTVDASFEPGITFFLESLEQDLMMEELMESAGGADQFVEAICEGCSEKKS